MAAMMAIGIDLGATKIAGSLVDDEGKVHLNRMLMTDAKDGIDSVVARIGKMARELAKGSPGGVRGLGIGSPGFIDSQGGMVLDATNLAWLDVPLVSLLRDEAKRSCDGSTYSELPIILQMDTFASTLGEYYFGAARACGDFVYLSIGSGFSAGLIAGGRLIEGSRNLAGQCGNYSLSRSIGEPGPDGPEDNAEAVLSGRGFLALARRFMEEGRLPTTLRAGDLSTRRILDAARAGDGLASAVVSEAGVTLSMVISAYLSFLNPAKIVIGGGLGMAAFDLLLPVLRRELPRRASPEYCKGLDILPSGQSSSAIGAACMVFREALPERFPL